MLQGDLDCTVLCKRAMQSPLRPPCLLLLTVPKLCEANTSDSIVMQRCRS